MKLPPQQFLLFLLLYLIRLKCATAKASSVQPCPSHQLSFVKVLGFRPHIAVASSWKLIRTNGTDITNTVTTTTTTTTTAINLRCLEVCTRQADCAGYVLLHNVSACYGFSRGKHVNGYGYLESDHQLTESPDAVWFEKSCLNIPVKCEGKLWPLARIPGSALIGQGFRSMRTLVTRRQCAEECMMDSDCRSATFRVSFRNNNQRFLGNRHSSTDDVGQCVLSGEDKFTRPESFRVASHYDEYMENQCVARASVDDRCAYETYLNSSFAYGELATMAVSANQCTAKCSQETRFNCLGASYVANSSVCTLHSEDTITLGPRALAKNVASIYMRRVKCLNLSVTCVKDEMIVRFVPTHTFVGRIYSNVEPNECSINGTGIGPTILRIPIGDEVQESKCGILRAYEIMGARGQNRTFISTLLVIQASPFALTQSDRLVKVGCVLTNHTGDDTPQLDVASSTAMPDSEPSNGSVLNMTATLPSVSMRIINGDDQLEAHDVQLGQSLNFRITVEPADSVYDVRVVNLIARPHSTATATPIVLLDEYGCPQDSVLFPALAKSQTDTAQILSAPFHAFKFINSTSVNFEVVVHFCMPVCSALVCEKSRRTRRQTPQQIVTSGEGISMIKFPQEDSKTLPPIVFPGPVAKRFAEPRQSDGSGLFYETFIGDFSAEVTSTPSVQESDTATPETMKMFPASAVNNIIQILLHVHLYVRGPEIADPEYIINGESSHILIAGIDIPDPTNTICVNQTVLVVMLGFWLILQLALLAACYMLVRKYRRIADLEEDRSSLHRIHHSLEYDTSSISRRVRWADQNNFLYR